VRSLGFSVFRVRHLAAVDQPPRARVLVAVDEFSKLPPLTSRLKGGLLAIGYSAVEIDPDGYKSPA